MKKPAVTVREAAHPDVGTMHRIRLSVQENALSGATRITEESYDPYLTARTAWVAETNGAIVGFAAVDSANRSVWALFVDPSAEGIGVGKALHDRMLQWSSAQGVRRLSLTTEPGTRAEQFYRGLGWSEVDRTAGGEILFERLI